MEDMLASLNYDSQASSRNRLIIVEYFKRSDEVARVDKLIDSGKPFRFKDKEYNCFHLFGVQFDKSSEIREFERSGFGVLCQSPRAGGPAGSFDILVAIYNMFRDPTKPIHTLLLDSTGDSE